MHKGLTCWAVVKFRSNTVTLRVSHLLVTTLPCIIWPLQHRSSSKKHCKALSLPQAQGRTIPGTQTHNIHHQVVFHRAESWVDSLLCVDGTTLAWRIKSELCPCQLKFHVLLFPFPFKTMGSVFIVHSLITGRCSFTGLSTQLIQPATTSIVRRREAEKENGAEFHSHLENMEKMFHKIKEADYKNKQTKHLASLQLN